MDNGKCETSVRAVPLAAPRPRLQSLLGYEFHCDMSMDIYNTFDHSNSVLIAHLCSHLNQGPFHPVN